MFVLQLATNSDEIDFLGEAFRLADGGFELEVPKKEQIWGATSRFGLGARLLDSYYENRKITITFEIHGFNRQDIVDKIGRIEAMLDLARRHSIDEDPDRVELRYRWSQQADDKQVYFEVVDGEFMLPSDVLSVGNILQNSEFMGVHGSVLYDCKLELTVLPHAFGVSPVNGSLIEVPLSNGNGTRVTGGILVYSHDDTDAQHDNWVSISGADVPGDAPAITKLQVLMVDGGSLPARIAVGHSLTSTPQFAHIIEDSIVESSAGRTQVSNAAASGGTYSSFDFTSVTPAKFATWNIANAHVYGGKAYRAVAVSFLGIGFASSMNYMLKLTSSTDDVFFQTDWVSPVETAVNYLDLGVVVLPPFQGKLTAVEDIKLSLWGFRKAAGTTTFSIDYIYLLPISEGYRALQNKLPVVSGAWGSLVIDDPWNGVVYASSGSKNLGTFEGMFAPIRLIPKKDQRLYFLFNDLYSFQPPTFRYYVRAWVAPLYKTLA